MYAFATIDPRPAQRAATLTLLASIPTLGIEVTDAALADACGLGNIDPQHGHDRGNLLPAGAFPAGYVREGCMAAIDVACGIALPPVGATLATIRPDLDSVGAMAVLVLRALGIIDFAVPTPAAQAAWRRVCDISNADSYRPGAWAPRHLPTPGQLFATDESHEPADARRSLAHLGAICSPRPGKVTIPLEERVAVMACWLLFGEPSGPLYFADDIRPAQRIYDACGVRPTHVGGYAADAARRINEARVTVESSRLALAEELSKPGAIRSECCRCGSPMEQDLRASRACADGCVPGLAQVRVSHAGALGAGYCVAPVVVAFDQATPGKVTIAAAEDGRADFDALCAALNAAEGRAAVTNSPTLVTLGIAAETDRLSLRDLGVPDGAEWTPRPDLSGTMAKVKMLHDRGRLIESVTISGPAPGHELRVIDLPKWGGPRNLLGSPQGTGTLLSEAQVIELVRATMTA